MNDKKSKLIVALLAINLIITFCLVGYIGYNKYNGPDIAGNEMEYSSKYTLYIGTNDKDTYAKMMPLDDAKKIVNEICMDHVGGYTVYEGNGGWLDDKGVETTEESLVYTFCDVSEEQIREISDEILSSLNQSSILVEHDNVRTTYYSR